MTDHNGEVYERLEYTPYGETWLDETSGNTYFDTPYRFSAKERDEESGLYYYGARYLDPKYSRWISADPALGEYLPQAPINDEAKKHNRSLPGQGGVFNVINLNLYHYAGNNPIKYTDPSGMFSWDEDGQGGTVTDKDTLSQITEDYNDANGTNLDYNDVAKANGIDDPDKIMPGQRIQLGSKQEHNNQAGNVSSAQIPNIDNGTYKTWANKTDGESLTPKEAKIQQGIGLSEMILGPVAGFGLAEFSGGESVLPGFYIMGDGAYVYSEGQNNKKVTPFSLLPDFILPYAKTDDGMIFYTGF